MRYPSTEKDKVPAKRSLPLRTLLVDDSPEFLGRLEKWLRAHSDFEIVGKAYSGFDALKQTRLVRPDLVIMDVAMPLMNGYEATARIKEGVHRPTIILISFFDRHGAHEGSDLNADAFIRKDSLYEELLPTVARLLSRPRSRTEADS